jgi:hypothetical protein
VSAAAAAQLPWGEKVAEAVGPIVVKEVRQGLRARVFVITFALLLAGCLLLAIVAVADTAGGRDEAGKRYFGLFFSALAVIEFFLIPYAAYRGMAREREEETWVLLALTGLPARHIVRGKIASALAQGLLYASAAAPFVVFSYFLNGIDLPAVLLSLTLGAVWSWLLVSVAVGLGTLANSRVGRGFTHFSTLALLVGATALGISTALVLADEWMRISSRAVEVPFATLGFAVLLAATAVLVAESAAAALALDTEDCARRPRQWLLGIVGASVAVGAAAMVLRGARVEFAAAGGILTALYLVPVGVFVVSERDGRARQLAARGRSPWAPGALRGYLLYVGLLVGQAAAWLGTAAALDAGHTLRSVEVGALRAMVAGPSYTLLYVSMAACLGRWFPRPQPQVSVRAAFVVLVLLGSVLPPVVSLLSHHRQGNDATLNVFNPLVGLVNFLDRLRYGDDGNVLLLLLVAVTAVVTFVTGLTLASRDGVRGV